MCALHLSHVVRDRLNALPPRPLQNANTRLLLVFPVPVFVYVWLCTNTAGVWLGWSQLKEANNGRVSRGLRDKSVVIMAEHLGGSALEQYNAELAELEALEKAQAEAEAEVARL